MEDRHLLADDHRPQPDPLLVPVHGPGEVGDREDDVVEAKRFDHAGSFDHAGDSSRSSGAPVGRAPPPLLVQCPLTMSGKGW